MLNHVERKSFIGSHTTRRHIKPVLIIEGDDLVIKYMRWGLIPSWYKGNIKDFKMNMINARKEGLGNVASFRQPLEKGQRCVVIAEGFYEWQTSKDGKKQPYYISPESKRHAALEAHITKEDASENPFEATSAIKTESFSNFSEQNDDFGRETSPLLTFAGIYDKNDTALAEGEVLCSYCIVTVPASTDLSFMHPRMPAVLASMEAVFGWLDCKATNLKSALELLTPCHGLRAIPVSAKVGNIRNTGPECRAPIRLQASPKNQHTNALTVGELLIRNHSYFVRDSPKWLMPSSPKKSTSSSAESSFLDTKLPKKETKQGSQDQKPRQCFKKEENLPPLEQHIQAQDFEYDGKPKRFHLQSLSACSSRQNDTVPRRQLKQPILEADDDDVVIIE